VRRFGSRSSWASCFPGTIKPSAGSPGGGHLLKCFRQPAGNQETVLATAEELQWLAWFDDPLPRTAGINPKQRVHDTINALNRNQTPYLVHFKGDGSGARFGWEMR
jgi:hypothetical protein